jgi:hypothetical protein
MSCIYIIANAIVKSTLTDTSCLVVRCNHVEGSTRVLLGGRVDYHFMHNRVSGQGYAGTKHGIIVYNPGHNHTCILLGPDLRGYPRLNRVYDATTIAHYKKQCRDVERVGDTVEEGKLIVRELLPNITFSPSCGFVALHFMQRRYPKATIYMVGFTFYNEQRRWHHDFKQEKQIVQSMQSTGRLYLLP